MKASVGLSANAGISLTLGPRRLWVDALHLQKTIEFSALTRPVYDRMLTHPDFEEPDYLIVTHDHPDHYFRPLTGEALRTFPDAKFLSPITDFPSAVPFDREEFAYEDKGLRFHFFRLIHDGDKYRDVVQYGFTVTHDGFTVLVPGDCRLAEPKLAEFISGTHIDLAILNFPWIATARGRVFVREYIHPDRILGVHLPFAFDDLSHYRYAAEHSLAKLDCPDARLLEESLQVEYYE